MMVEIQGVQRYFSSYVYETLQGYKQYVAHNWDGVILVCGYEGDGKSWFAAQIASFLDPTFSVDNVVFTTDDLLKAIDAGRPGQAIVLDEGQDSFDTFGDRKTYMKVKRKLTRARKKKLYIIIVAADVWRINKYLFVHRSRGIFHVYARGLERGFVEYYNRQKKHELYMKAKKTEDFSLVAPSYRTDTGNWFPIDEEAYERKKDAAMKEPEPTTARDVKKLQLVSAFKVLRFLKTNRWINDQGLTAACKSIGTSIRTYYRYAERGALDNEDSDNKVSVADDTAINLLASRLGESSDE